MKESRCKFLQETEKDKDGYIKRGQILAISL